MPRTFDFVAGSLYPDTILDVSVPEPGPSSLDPIVKHLPIIYGDHSEVGVAKRLLYDSDGNLLIADDRFQVSTLSLETAPESGPRVPKVTRQDTIKARTGTTWAGLISVQSGAISALTSGQLLLHHSSASASTSSRTVPSPLLAVSSPGSDATSFALAGKEVDVSVWDVEKTFAQADSIDGAPSGKRKKNELERGEVWRAKNMPNNSLAIRPPNHHLCLTHLPLVGPNHLASGTKSGTVRTYDTRQRKPVHEWKVAREGGVGTIAQGVDEHQIFFSDRSNLLGAIDLRTGRLLYSYPNMSSTPQTLLTLPCPPQSSTTRYGLASVSSDAALRIHSTLPSKKEGERGNVGGGAQKAKVEAMVGGVGICNVLWAGWGQVADAPKEKQEGKGEAEDDGGEDEDDEDDDEIWEGMGELEESDSESEAEDLPKSKKRK